MQHRPPLIGVTACYKKIKNKPHHTVDDQYISALLWLGCLPVVLPAVGEQNTKELFARLDGLLITGSPSNVEPHLYGATPSKPDIEYDSQRDKTNLPLIRAAVEQGVPFLAICRGMQELNVALGGTLHQDLKSMPEKLNHPKDYKDTHPMFLTSGGYLAQLLGVTEIDVNTVHNQGIDRLGQNLVVEATASDGLIEAVTIKNAKRFALAVQWHPEWDVATNPISQKIFQAFLQDIVG